MKIFKTKCMSLIVTYDRQIPNLDIPFYMKVINPILCIPTH